MLVNHVTYSNMPEINQSSRKSVTAGQKGNEEKEERVSFSGQTGQEYSNYTNKIGRASCRERV